MPRIWLLVIKNASVDTLVPDVFDKCADWSVWIRKQSNQQMWPELHTEKYTVDYEYNAHTSDLPGTGFPCVLI